MWDFQLRPGGWARTCASWRRISFPVAVLPCGSRDLLLCRCACRESCSSSQTVSYLYPSLWTEGPAGEHNLRIEFSCMKTFPEKHVGLMTSWVFCSWLGDFWRPLSANGAHSHPEPIEERTEGMHKGSEDAPAPSLLHSVQKQSSTQCIPWKLYQLLTISCLQIGSVGMLALYGQNLREGVWRSTICVSVGWHHLCTINIAVG